MNNLIVEKQDSLLKLKLNRPEKHNALDDHLMESLTETLKKYAGESHDIKAVLISGEGKSLCSGADLNWMSKMVDYDLEQNIEDSNKLYDLFESIYNFPLPVIAHAHGSVYGGGLGLLAAADFVLADENTKFCFSEVKLGLAPAVISSFVLSKCNKSEATALMTSGLVFDFQTAVHLGLVNADLHKSNEVINSYLSASASALKETKKLCRNYSSIEPKDFKKNTVQVISELRTSPESQKRMKKFLERRI